MFGRKQKALEEEARAQAEADLHLAAKVASFDSRSIVNQLSVGDIKGIGDFRFLEGDCALAKELVRLRREVEELKADMSRIRDGEP